MLFAISAGLFASAQTDVTSKFITNPSFENNGSQGWTVSNLVAQSNNSFTKKQGAVYLEKWVDKGGAVGNGAVSQIISSLPAGNYTLTVAAQNLDQNNTSAKKTGASIYAGKSKTIVYTPDDYSVTFNHINGEVEIGFTASNAQGNWISVDNFRLYHNGPVEAEVAKSSLKTVIDEANKRYGDGTGINASEFKSAIDEAQSILDNEASTSEQLTDAITNVYDALNKYNLDNVSEENPIDVTSYITNPSFETNGDNGWTNVNMKSQTNTSFTKKKGSVYMEKWVDKGLSVGDASLSQVIQLPNGIYKLTAAAQNLDQNRTTAKNAGAWLYAGEEKESVYTPNDYSVKFTSISGKIEIGFLAQKAGGNWLAVDNFRLYLIGNVDKSGVLSELNKLIEDANALLSDETPANSSAVSRLNSGIQTAQALTESSSDSEIADASIEIKDAMAEVNASKEEHKAVKEAIDKANKSYDSSKEGASDFQDAISNAESVYNNGDATSQELSQAIISLDKAELAFNLANPTGTTAPKVTKTNTYVPTGANEALMRATITGSNILEKGVCWSTEHEPTVLDNRTTKSFSLNGDIFHVKGLEAATVYYLRPYAINKYYNVAYGDEVKIVTHKKGDCVGSWDGGAPTAEANTRCRNAINETIEYFNQWTGINGFHLSGHYGASTPTADCSYGGWMRIGPNAGNQAIGTVIHETGHGVGVGTSGRYADKNVHDRKWKGREANAIYSFLENKEANPYTSEFCMVGDGTHAWGASATYDWFVNGADKDKHTEIQYIGGCCLLYGFFIDGLNPTNSYSNGIAGYTYNYDDAKKYYIMSKDSERGLGEALVSQVSATAIGWITQITGEEVNDSSAWYIEYNPNNGNYSFKNASTGKYMTHASGGSNVTLKALSGNPSSNEQFQLMPDRTDITVGTGSLAIKTHGYWFTWNASGNKSMGANTMSSIRGYGPITQTDFDYSDSATKQQWIIISEDELEKYQDIAVATGIKSVTVNSSTGEKSVVSISSLDGMQMNSTQKGFNIIRYSDGTSKKIYVK